jgi:hypothetical protein
MKMKINCKIACIIIVLSLFSAIRSSIFTYNNCSSLSIFNSKTLQCDLCPTNSIADPSELIPSSCVCQPGYIRLSGQNDLCSKISLTCNDTQIYNVYSIDGSVNLPSACADCDSNAYPNS